MLVVGGYNSSNTCNLANICAARVPTYHIAEPDVPRLGLGDPAPAGRPGQGPPAGEAVARDWLPDGPLTVGLTAGASTPNNIVGDVVTRLAAAAGGPAFAAGRQA